MGKRGGARKSVAPLQLLLDHSRGSAVPLPRALAHLYGSLRFPKPAHRPYVIGNFASTLDGVVSLGGPGPSSGGEITGFDAQDRMLMGVLRAVSDAVVIGAGTLRAVPRHTWTAEHIYPDLAAPYADLRQRLGHPAAPLNVVVTRSGRVDLSLPLFAAGQVPVLVLTTSAGARRLESIRKPRTVEVVSVRTAGPLSAGRILDALRARIRPRIVLVEGGPHLMGSFLDSGRLDELFLTVSPQVAGRNGTPRPGFVAGRTFAPSHPLWGSLSGVRAGERSLFLRFRFDSFRGREPLPPR